MRFVSGRGPKHGQERVVTRFLWWPVTVGLETRWLERATLRQTYYASYGGEWWLTEGFLPGAPNNSHETQQGDESQPPDHRLDNDL